MGPVIILQIPMFMPATGTFSFVWTFFLFLKSMLGMLRLLWFFGAMVWLHWLDQR